VTVLEDIGHQLAAVADLAGGSVVRLGSSWHGGSGVVIGNGLIATNAHNVHGDSTELAFADGRSVAAQLRGIDVDGDLAVLAADTGSATALDWASEQAAIGSPVFAIAATGSAPRVTFGFVSSVARAFRGPRGRRIAGSLEHTAPLAPGSSGSALVDGTGRLLGINTNRLGSGFYLALPADAALRQRLDALGRGEHTERPRLGVGIAPSWVARRMRRAVGLTERDGVLVREVEAGSAAERAGVVEGDLIVEAAGRPIHDPDDVYDALATVGQGGKLTLRVVRGADERAIEVSL
jgi:serine protease Do